MTDEEERVGSEESQEDSDLIAFLKKRGVVELLATINAEGVRYGYLEESLGISHDTVSKHLSRAQELGLIEPESIRGERGVTHHYVLTPLGATLHRKLKQMGAVDDFQLLQMYRRRIPEYKEEIRDWVREEESEDELRNHRRNVSDIQFLQGTFPPEDSTDDE